MSFEVENVGDGFVIVFNVEELSADLVIEAFSILRESGALGATFLIYDFRAVEIFTTDIAEMHRMAIRGQLDLDYSQSTRVALVMKPGPGEGFAEQYLNVRNFLTGRSPTVQAEIQAFVSFDQARAWATATADA